MCHVVQKKLHVTPMAQVAAKHWELLLRSACYTGPDASCFSLSTSTGLVALNTPDVLWFWCGCVMLLGFTSTKINWGGGGG